MSAVSEKVEHEALSLSRQVDAAWVAEAKRRYQEYKEGKRQGVAARDVFAEADKMLRK